VNCSAAANSGLFGSKHHSQQSAAEIRPVDALARTGEKQLLDHVANVIVVVGRRRASARIKMKWKIYIHHVPFTLTWVTTMLSGVPVGAQID